MDMQVGFPPYGVTLASVDWFRQRINEAETGIGGEMPLFVFDNHDNPRWDRWVTSDHKDDVGRVIATVLFASRDTAMMYYGDEIGMATTPPTRKEDVKDPSASPAGRSRRVATASARPCSGTTAQTLVSHRPV